jgi:hypothetical protein
MEALKIIPQVFFDIIARVIPGCVSIVAYFILCKKTLESSVAVLFGDSFAKGSPTLSFFIFLGTGYVVGELISPAAKVIQRFNEKIPLTIKEYKKMKEEKEKNKKKKE